MSPGGDKEIEDEANRKRSEATKKQPRTKDGKKLAGSPTSSGATRRHSKAGSDLDKGFLAVKADQAAVKADERSAKSAI